MSISEASNVIALDRPALPSVETSREKHLPVLAEQVRSHSQSSTASIIAIGKALLEAKEHLKHGQFCEWVSRECGFTIRSAQNYMRVAELVAREGEMFSLLNPAIIYRLAAPKTPRAVFACVVEMFRRGLVPTEAEVLVLTLAYSWKGEDAGAPTERAGDQATHRLARELRARLGHELVAQLIGSRWSDLRKHLRSAIEQQSDRAAELQSSQVCTEAAPGDLQVQ